MSRRRVVIFRAGFAGLNAAKALENAPVDVTIIDRRKFHLFQPRLYQVATAALNPSDIAYPIRSVFKGQANVDAVLMAEVVDIDTGLKAIELDDGSTIDYDYLLLATGATHSYFGHDEWEESAPDLKTVEDALTIRGRVLRAFEEAERNPADERRWLTFVVVGAGPTGVELAGALAEIALHALGDEFDIVDPQRVRVVLVEGTDRVLPPYPESLSDSARRQLEDLGVEVLTGSIVEEIDEQGVTLSNGQRIEAALSCWRPVCRLRHWESCLAPGPTARVVSWWSRTSRFRADPKCWSWEIWPPSGACRGSRPRRCRWVSTLRV